MGQLVDGVWQDAWYDTESSGGRFVREGSSYRHWIRVARSPDSANEPIFRPGIDRYHLYVSLACPWAHRTLLMRKFKDLESIVSVSIVHWLMREDGWTFQEAPGVVPDPILHARFLRDIYTAADPRYTGRVTVPVLWDKERGTIVNNESSDIVRMFNCVFDGFGANAADFYPAAHRDEIDAVNVRVYETLNNGVYKAGFATTQDAYEEAVAGVFETLSWLEARLSRQIWLVGDSMTEADIRLFTTLIRFDTVYFHHFKCNVGRIADYTSLYAYLLRIRRLPGVEETINFEHIKRHYYESHRSINPYGIVPVGPIGGV